MNNIVDLKKYKKAKVIAKDLEQAIHIMELSTQGLSKFAKYVPVMESLAVMQQQKTILKIYLDKCNDILKPKE